MISFMPNIGHTVVIPVLHGGPLKTRYLSVFDRINLMSVNDATTALQVPINTKVVVCQYPTVLVMVSTV